MLKTETYTREIEVQKVVSYCDGCGKELETKELGLSSTKDTKIQEWDVFPYSEYSFLNRVNIYDKNLRIRKCFCPECKKAFTDKVAKELIKFGYEEI